MQQESCFGDAASKYAKKQMSLLVTAWAKWVSCKQSLPLSAQRRSCICPMFLFQKLPLFCVSQVHNLNPLPWSSEPSFQSPSRTTRTLAPTYWMEVAEGFHGILTQHVEGVCRSIAYQGCPRTVPTTHCQQHNLWVKDSKMEKWFASHGQLSQKPSAEWIGTELLLCFE